MCRRGIPGNLCRVLGLALLTASCTHTQSDVIRVSPSVYEPQADPSTVMVLSGGTDRPYEVLAIVSADKKKQYGDIQEHELIPLLQKEAAALGADALIDLEFERYHGRVWLGVEGNAMTARAKAIRFTDGQESSRPSS